MAARVIVTAALVVFIAAGLATVLALGVGGNPSNKEPIAEKRYSLQEYPCLKPAASWRCARLVTPDGFELEVRRLVAAEPDSSVPLIYLQGGPGLDAGFSSSDLEYWQSWRDFAGLKRDLVLMQRRGTDPNSPWRCSQYERLGRKLLGRSVSLQEEFELGRTALSQCLDSLPGFNPRHFGTRQNRADLEALVRLWDFTEFHLYGASYGSRLAIAAADISGLNTLVLDAVYPPGKGGVAEWPTLFGGALDRFAAACESDTSCHEMWQQYYLGRNLDRHNVLEQLHSSLDYLARFPVQVDVMLEGLPQRVVLNDHRFMAAFFAASYRRDRWASAVQAIAAARTRDRKALAPLIERYANQVVSTSVNSLAFFAVDCRDNLPGEEDTYEERVASLGFAGQYVERGWRDQMCHLWPSAEPPVIPTLTNNVRVAMVNGVSDPITPAYWAVQLQKQWADSELTLYPRTGHVVMGEQPCALEQLEIVLSGEQSRFSACP
ncbi:alpha/beta hydrolase [Gilvimarinus chinensis]|uniref:alpha/beta hydrolase n=1 Tax=Gilvimarinus chinensis TaxID=396005 RepID=UPI00037DB58B|nr:alpha/beta hydrolase [Gilvimarinus chinensis]